MRSLRSVSFDLVASVYVLAAEAKDDSNILGELNERADLKGKRVGVSHEQHVLTASLKMSGRKVNRSTKGLWTKGVEALAHVGLPANFQAARDWFDVREDVNGDGQLLAGFEKSQAICKGQAESEESKRLADVRDAKKQERWKALTESSKFKAEIGHIKIAESAELEEGAYVFQLGRVGKNKITMLDVCITEQEVVRKLVLTEKKLEARQTSTQWTFARLLLFAPLRRAARTIR